MLRTLRIRDIALIDRLTVSLEDGFTVLTGETGAGKSILIDSINAILGNRTSKDLVRTGAAKAVIRAAFENVPPAVLDSLEKAGYERSEALLLSREITAEGKSTCRINGMPATAAIPAYIYDAVTSGELTDVAKITGFVDIERRSFCHVLNSRAMALRYAREHGKHYEELNLIVAHLGGGISASVHRHGEIIDSVGDDDGQFSPERSGCVPSLGLIKLCYSGKYTYEEMRKKIRGRGGMYAHLGTSDCRVIEQMIRDGDRHADLIFQAQAYQIAKAIGLLSIVLKGDCDAIILTGGVANSKMLTERVEDYVKFIAPVCVMPGENEMEALALGGMRILQGEENARIYHIVNGVNGKEGQG